jgi:hypothetical protein
LPFVSTVFLSRGQSDGLRRLSRDARPKKVERLKHMLNDIDFACATCQAVLTPKGCMLHASATAFVTAAVWAQ